MASSTASTRSIFRPSRPSNNSLLSCGTAGLWPRRFFIRRSHAVARSRWASTKPLRDRLCLEAPLHVGVCNMDELSQGRIIDLLAGPELDVPHELARTFQQAACIREFGATKEADVHVVPERIDVTECGISDTRRGMTVMQQLPYVIS